MFAVKKTENVPEEIFDAVSQSVNNCFGGGIKFGYP